MTDLTRAANAPGPDMFPRDRYTFQEFLGLERWVDGEVVRVRLRHRKTISSKTSCSGNRPIGAPGRC